MSQYDILELLENHKGKWLSVEQIAKKLNRTSMSISTTLAKVKRFKEIKFKMKKDKTLYKGYYKFTS